MTTRINHLNSNPFGAPAFEIFSDDPADAMIFPPARVAAAAETIGRAIGIDLRVCASGVAIVGTIDGEPMFLAKRY